MSERERGAKEEWLSLFSLSGSLFSLCSHRLSAQPAPRQHTHMLSNTWTPKRRNGGKQGEIKGEKGGDEKGARERERMRERERESEREKEREREEEEEGRGRKRKRARGTEK